MVRNSDLDGARFCGINLGGNCGSLDEVNSWTIEVPDGKPEVETPQAPEVICQKKFLDSCAQTQAISRSSTGGKSEDKSPANFRFPSRLDLHSGHKWEDVRRDPVLHERDILAGQSVRRSRFLGRLFVRSAHVDFGRYDQANQGRTPGKKKAKLLFFARMQKDDLQNGNLNAGLFSQSRILVT